MSENISSSSSSNLSLQTPPPSSLNSPTPSLVRCFEITVGTHIFAAVSCSYVLLFLPLCIFILHLGLQRLRRDRSAATSSLDVFTYNIIAMEMVGVLGCSLYSCSIYMQAPMVKLVGIYIVSTITAGQMMFHTLTCFERYLAVIHPVFYLGLKKAGGERLRNISIGFAWGLSFGWIGVTAQSSPNFPTIALAVLLTSSFLVTSYFSLSVLLALTRPGPGEVGRDRADQLKRRAFHTIATITGALTLRFGAQLLCFVLEVSGVLSGSASCVALLSGISLCVPSSYVLPLLFLHRDGKLPCFNTKLIQAET
ncbi:unnamed protein product [Pleuronectes platessa]|uniref:G-protein coupled receptors family 1 profile domain-containing protein n=1 Tax=Pleuronectes platessa TaxID=8262 RepID=A0A9N7UZZ6_PLEPL|nr:unnamed protein product [Pleuronectes platessa]